MGREWRNRGTNGQQGTEQTNLDKQRIWGKEGSGGQGDIHFFLAFSMLCLIYLLVCLYIVCLVSYYYFLLFYSLPFLPSVCHFPTLFYYTMWPDSDIYIVYVLLWRSLLPQLTFVADMETFNLPLCLPAGVPLLPLQALFSSSLFSSLRFVVSHFAFMPCGGGGFVCVHWFVSAAIL